MGKNTCALAAFLAGGEKRLDTAIKAGKVKSRKAVIAGRKQAGNKKFSQLDKLNEALDNKTDAEMSEAEKLKVISDRASARKAKSKIAGYSYAIKDATTVGRAKVGDNWRPTGKATTSPQTAGRDYTKGKKAKGKK